MELYHSTEFNVLFNVLTYFKCIHLVDLPDGLGVMCWPRDTRSAGSNSAETEIDGGTLSCGS